MLVAASGAQFKRDARRAVKRGKDMSKLSALIHLLLNEQTVPAKHNVHALKGEWLGSLELHIEPDWLLIYYIDGNDLHLVRTGTHADLFSK